VDAADCFDGIAGAILFGLDTVTVRSAALAVDARRAARAAREAEEGKRILEQAEKEARETWPPPNKPPPN
jgi:CxxC motif-containing protein (DUF1111 family)